MRGPTIVYIVVTVYDTFDFPANSDQKRSRVSLPIVKNHGEPGEELDSGPTTFQPPENITTLEDSDLAERDDDYSAAQSETLRVAETSVEENPFAIDVDAIGAWFEFLGSSQTSDGKRYFFAANPSASGTLIKIYPLEDNR